MEHLNNHGEKILLGKDTYYCSITGHSKPSNIVFKHQTGCFVEMGIRINGDERRIHYLPYGGGNIALGEIEDLQGNQKNQKTDCMPKKE